LQASAHVVTSKFKVFHVERARMRELKIYKNLSRLISELNKAFILDTPL